MKRILVTGGAGFIGSHLCRALLKQGHRVTALDSFITGNEQNLSDIIDHDRLKLVEQNITVPYDGEFDRIYNLACPASPIHYQHDPVQTLLANVVGSYNMLELARKNKARILQASTSEVYGNPHVHPQPETYFGNVNPIGPRACYDEGKRAAEALFFDYHREHGVEIKIVRIFNTYGPGMDRHDGRVIANFIWQAVSNADLTVYGDGSQTRSFCYIDDMIEGITRMMESPAAITGPINLGNPDEYSIEALADTILEISGSASGFAYKRLPQDDPRQRKPDITLAKTMLDWEPKTSLDRGLTKTIDWFKKQLSVVV